MPITEDPILIKVFERLNLKKGLDFTQYKENMLKRRIGARLKKHGLSSYDEYLEVLEKDPCEIDELISALSINVTEFFRNPESFEVIDNIVVPRVLFTKRENRHKIIRAWSCGCSSGDEPYSLAITFLEKLDKARDKFLLTIVGSDIDRFALDEAKNMVYSRNRLKALDETFIDKYFKKTEKGDYKLAGNVRNMVKFRYHNVVNDRPYTHCDIILCRNLLIYFNKQLQEEVLLKFYDCLNPGGFLVLGMTESLVGSAAGRFESVDNRRRIYRKPLRAIDAAGKEGLLSQQEIDKIVNDMIIKP